MDEPTTARRDRLTLRLLAAFFAVFGLLVWVGLFWEQSADGRWVNAGAGLALVLAGAVSFLMARRSGRRDGASSRGN